MSPSDYTAIYIKSVKGKSVIFGILVIMLDRQYNSINRVLVKEKSTEIIIIQPYS